MLFTLIYKLKFLSSRFYTDNLYSGVSKQQRQRCTATGKHNIQHIYICWNSFLSMFISISNKHIPPIMRGTHYYLLIFSQILSSIKLINIKLLYTPSCHKHTHRRHAHTI